MDESFYLACLTGDLKSLELMKGSSKFDINTRSNCDGSTAFIWIINDGSCANYLDVAEFLFRNNADVNIQDNIGKTPLMCAIDNFEVEFSEILLKNGANIDIQDNDGNTALMYLCSQYCKYETNDFEDDYLKMLINNGADVNIQNKLGETALMISSRENNVNYFEILVKNGADLNIRNKKGECALDYQFNARYVRDDLIPAFEKIILDTMVNIETEKSISEKPDLAMGL